MASPNDALLVQRELAETLQQIARLYRRFGWPASPSDPQFQASKEEIRFINRSGETVPPYGCMQITGTADIAGRTVFEIVKPDAATRKSESEIIFNGSRSVDDDDLGIAQQPTIVQAIKDEAETESEFALTWGPTDDQWYLSPNAGSFVYYGVDEVDDNVIVVKVPSGGSAIRYFVLAEDLDNVDQVDVYAWQGKVDSDSLSIDRDTSVRAPVKLVNLERCFTSGETMARAGYVGTMAPDPSGSGRWIPVSTYSCISSCAVPAGSGITQPELANGTEDASYTPETIVVSEDVTSVAVTGLPAGLTFDAETLQISGTPTQAGTFWITFEGEVGSCTVTRLARLVIEPAPEE